MILEFKTPRGTYGRRDYLKIDTDKKEYTRFCPYVNTPGYELKTKADYKDLIYDLRRNGYTEKDR